MLRLLALTLFPLSAAAGDMTWQGRILDAAGGPLNGEHSLTLTLFDDATAGSSLATTTFADVTLAGGYVTLTLPDAFEDAVAENPSTWLAIGIDDAAPLATRQPLGVTPYAVVASRVNMTSSTPEGSCTAPGTIVYDRTSEGLFICDGDWTAIAGGGARAVEFNGSFRAWGDGTYATSCDTYRNPPTDYTYDGDIGDGVYRIDPDGSGGSAPFDAYCDMTTQLGGWTLVAKVHGADDFWQCGNTPGCSGSQWRSSGLTNEAVLDVTAAHDAKYAAWNSVVGTDVMFWDTAAGAPLLSADNVMGSRTFAPWVATFPDPGATTSCGQEWPATYVGTGYAHPFCKTTNCDNNARLGVFCRDEEPWSRRDFTLFAMPNSGSFDYNYGNKPGLASDRFDPGHGVGTHVDVDAERGGVADGRAWTTGAVAIFVR